MLKKAFLILFIILIKFLFAQQTKNESLIQFYIEGTLIAQPLKLQSDTPLFSGVTFIDMFSARKFTSVHLDHAYGTVELNTLWVVRLAGWQVGRFNFRHHQNKVTGIRKRDSSDSLQGSALSSDSLVNNTSSAELG